MSTRPESLPGPRELCSFSEVVNMIDDFLAQFAPPFSDDGPVVARRNLCPGCREPIAPGTPPAPMGMTGEQLKASGYGKCLCPGCGFPLRPWKSVPKSAPTCRICGEPVTEAGPVRRKLKKGERPEKIVACAVCLIERLEKRAAGLLAEPRSEAACPDCGGPRRRNATRCPDCAAKRRRGQARERQRRRRRAGAAVTVAGA